MNPSEHEHIPTDPETWSGLLAHWTTLAKAAVALPEDAAGVRWRESIPCLIGLHALACALGDLARLPAGERSLALDRAEVAIREHASSVHRIWGSEPLPEAVSELIEDARQSLARAETLGLEGRVAVEGFVMPGLEGLVDRLLGLGFGGDLLAAAAGTRLAPGSPAVFCRPPIEAPAIEGIEWASGPTPARQVYRTVEDGAARDVVSVVEGSLLPGRPLLGFLIQAGERAPRAGARDPVSEPGSISLETAREASGARTMTTGSRGSEGDATRTE